MTSRKKILLSVFLIVPAILLVTFFVVTFYTFKNAPSFDFPIESYNPRKPVSDQSFDFQIKWPWRAENPLGDCRFSAPHDCHICVTQQNGKTRIGLVSATTLPSTQCAATLDHIHFFDKAPRGSLTPVILILYNEPRSFVITPHERAALENYAKTHPNGFSMRAKIHNGEIYPTHLLIDGKPYRESLPKTLPPAPAKP